MKHSRVGPRPSRGVPTASRMIMSPPFAPGTPTAHYLAGIQTPPLGQCRWPCRLSHPLYTADPLTPMRSVGGLMRAGANSYTAGIAMPATAARAHTASWTAHRGWPTSQQAGAAHPSGKGPEAHLRCQAPGSNFLSSHHVVEQCSWFVLSG